MSSYVRYASRALLALVTPAMTTRRSISEILEVGYKFANGPHSTQDLDAGQSWTQCGAALSEDAHRTP